MCLIDPLCAAAELPQLHALDPAFRHTDFAGPRFRFRRLHVQDEMGRRRGLRAWRRQICRPRGTALQNEGKAGRKEGTAGGGVWNARAAAVGWPHRTDADSSSGLTLFDIRD